MLQRRDLITRSRALLRGACLGGSTVACGGCCAALRALWESLGACVAFLLGLTKLAELVQTSDR